MATQRIGIILHGVTGRMGYNQHLIRSIQAIIQEGGLVLSNGDRLIPDPILVGRNAKKMEALAEELGDGLDEVRSLRVPSQLVAVLDQHQQWQI